MSLDNLSTFVILSPKLLMEAHHIQLHKSMMEDEETLAVQFKHFLGG
jgi:hypothetical protein